MAKYRKKPVVIEAIQWTKETDIELESWLCQEPSVELEIDDHLYTAGVGVPFISSIKIKTLEGTMRASVGDYIIKGVNGEFYPCKPDIFEKTYELVKEDETLKDSLKLYKMVERAGNGYGFDLVKAWEYHKNIEQALTTKSEREQALEIIVVRGLNVDEFKHRLAICKDEFNYEYYRKNWEAFGREILAEDELNLVAKVVKEIGEDERK